MKWVKFWRVLIWGMAIVGMSVGAGLLARGGLSVAVADGTYKSLEFWGKVFLGVSLWIGVVNLAWGAMRWGLRWRREHWKFGRVMGKLVGGGIWRGVVVMPVVLVSLLAITPLVQQWVIRNGWEEEEREMGSVGMLREDFVAGKLTADEYVNYLLDATYDAESLPKGYWSLQYIMPSELLGPIEENLGILSAATRKRVLETTSLSGVGFDEDAEGNVAGRGWFGAERAYATTSSVVTLNKARLSASGKFVVFYTDKGDDAITEQQAAELAEMLDDVIRRYKSELGLDYSYEKYLVNGSKLPGVKAVLIKNGIDENILDIAMPVYVANPYRGHSNTLASYAGLQFKEFWTKVAMSLAGAFDGGEVGDMSKLYNSAPTLPFVNILPENLNDKSLKLVTAHELGHHYAGNYCYVKFKKACDTADFIDETLPNYMAVNVVPGNEQRIGNLIQTAHHNTYVKAGTCYKIDTVVPEPSEEDGCHTRGSMLGYPAVAFLQNYAEVVPGAMEIMLGALRDGNALETLYNATTPEKFKEVMTNLTQRNLTNDYGGKTTLKAIDLPKGEEIPCNDICEESYYIAPASSRYLYFAPSEYDKVKVTVSVLGSKTVSVLGRQGTRWSVIEVSDEEVSYVVNDASDYNMIAFAVASYAIEGAGSFTMNISSEELAGLVDEEAEIGDEFGELGEFGGGVQYNGGNCIGINFDDVLDFPVRMLKILSDYRGLDYGAVIAELEARNQAAKEEMVYHYARICLNQLKVDEAFEQVVRKVKNAVGWNWEFFRVDMEDAYHLSMIATYDLLLNRGKFYFLIQSGDGLQLMRVTMEQKAPTQ